MLFQSPFILNKKKPDFYKYYVLRHWPFTLANIFLITYVIRRALR